MLTNVSQPCARASAVSHSSLRILLPPKASPEDTSSLFRPDLHTQLARQSLELVDRGRQEREPHAGEPLVQIQRHGAPPLFCAIVWALSSLHQSITRSPSHRGSTFSLCRRPVRGFDAGSSESRCYFQHAPMVIRWTYNTDARWIRTDDRSTSSAATRGFWQAFSRSYVGLTGLEPVTSALSVLRSNQLSYSPEGLEATRSGSLFFCRLHQRDGRHTLAFFEVHHPNTGRVSALRCDLAHSHANDDSR